MAEILLPACRFPRLSDGATCRDIQPEALCQACTAHVQVAALRARLESAEAALLKYGYHRPSCPAFIDAASNCVCGWQVVRGDARLAQETAALGTAGERSEDG